MDDSAPPIDGKLCEARSQQEQEQSRSDKARGTSTLNSYLTTLSTPGLESINTRDWTLSSPAMRLALQHLHPSFMMTFEGHAMAFYENMAFQRAFAEADPGYRVDITDVAVDADEVAGVASVIMQFDVRGVSGVGKMKGMTELSWRREDDGEKGKWWCVAGAGMRGSEIGSGFV